MTDAATLDDLLACPRCDRTPLERTDRGFHCPGCKTDFPQVSDIPWLFAEPDAALGEWRRRLQFAVQQLRHEEDQVARSRKQKDLLASTKQRLDLLQTANGEHRKALTALLAPLDIGAMQETHASHLAMRTRLPIDQGLNTYYHNVHRDWVWGDAENEASIQQLEAVLGDTPTGDCLILGAGAGRLAYDLHRRDGAARTVVVDFNPMLLIVAQAMYRGDSLELYEFPIAPNSLENIAVRQTLRAPEAAAEGLHLILADVLRAPFAKASFDTVITPWLVDILSEDLRVFSKRINRLLKDDGRWVSFGSLAFEHPDRARRYSPDEVAEVAAEAGFDTPVMREDTIPYMCSPLSRHGRQEQTVTFRADKQKKVKAPARHKALPDWIVVGKEPVPILPAFQTQAMSTRIYAFIMSLIDGKRSIEDMAKLLEQQRLMPKQEAVPAIQSFLTRMYDDSQRNPNL